MMNILIKIYGVFYVIRRLYLKNRQKVSYNGITIIYFCQIHDPAEHRRTYQNHNWYLGDIHFMHFGVTIQAQ